MREKRARGTLEDDAASRSEAAEGSPQEPVPLMRLAPGERFYKFYIFSEPDVEAPHRVEHRIITKEHVDGSLEMVSYNAWLADGQTEKRDVIRVPSLSKALLDQVVERVRTQSDVPPEGYREIDLSRCKTIDEQLRALARLHLEQSPLS